MENLSVGIENERLITKELNNKRLDKTSVNFRYMLFDMFKNYPKDSILNVRKVPERFLCKTDLEFWVLNSYMNVSVKTGFGPAVHQEEFESFMSFLETLKISRKTLRFIRFYHFADETYDGSGIKTLRLSEFWEKYKVQIREASKELSQPFIVRAIVQRCVIKGKRETLQPINYLYYGDEKHGVFVHRNDIWKYVCDLEERDAPYLHFGPFKYVQKIHKSQIVDGKYRQHSQICWPFIKEDILIIFKKTFVYTSGRVPLPSF